MDRAAAAAVLRANPSAPPAAGAIAILVWLAADDGGFSAADWQPAGILLLALLAGSLLILPRPRPGRLGLVAVLALAGYALWSYLSIGWAPDKSLAWEGANRTLVYAVVLAQFALWPMRGRLAGGLLGAWGLAVGAIGLVTLLRADANAARFFFEGRLAEPVGYVNANVALWGSGLWACAVLAGRREVLWPLRGVFLATAALLAALALMGQSRGFVVALPLTALLALVLVPGRGRTLATLLLLAAGAAAFSGPVLEVYDGYRPGEDLSGQAADAAQAVLVVAAVLGLLGAGIAFLDRRVNLGERTARRLDRAALAGAAAVGLAAFVAVTVAVGNPFTKASDFWEEFKRGGVSPAAGQARLTGTAATDRYDFWRVGASMFADRPLGGYGADNFQQEYFVRGKGDQRPRYAHSLEIRVLAGTGAVGALLLGGCLVAGFAALAPALRRHGLAASSAGGGGLVCAYWLAHGSLDWLWEFPALGGSAFALLGMGIAAASQLREPAEPPGHSARGARRVVLAGACVLGAGLGALALAAPWLSARETKVAGREWVANQDAAFARLERAAALNPLSPLPHLVGGTIAARIGRPDKARAEFEAARERNAREAYAFLQLGALASQREEGPEAIRLLERAVALNPRYDVALEALAAARKGEALDPAELGSKIRAASRSRIGLEEGTD